jgi:preprotein translocase subunit SecG
MLHTAVLIAHLIVAGMIVGLVLLQRGKGAEAGSGFGAGASGTVFGARGSANFLSRSTGVLATLFFITSLTLAYMSTQREAPKSLLDAPATEETKAPSPSPSSSGASDLPQLPSNGGAAPSGDAPKEPSDGANGDPAKQ